MAPSLCLIASVYVSCHHASENQLRLRPSLIPPSLYNVEFATESFQFYFLQGVAQMRHPQQNLTQPQHLYSSFSYKF